MIATDLRPFETALTLGLSALGAWLFTLIGFPAAPLTGPATVVALATLLGLRTHVPDLLRDACFLTLGIGIGSTVTPEVIATALRWPLSLVILTICLVISIFVVRLTLERGFNFDRMTALLASTPGHLSYVIGLSSGLKADVPKVAIVQSIRVLLLTLVVPVVIALWGIEGTTPPSDQAQIAALPLALTFAAALALGIVLKRFQVPAAVLLGAMFVSALGHGSNLTPGAPPLWLTLCAFLIMGALIGTRFNGVARADLKAAFLAGVVGTMLACLIAITGALIAAGLVGLPPAAVVLAFAPGGVEVMAALAVETGLEPAFVAAHHVIRLVILTAVVPLFMAADRRRR